MVPPLLNAYFRGFSGRPPRADKVSMRLCYHNAPQVMSVLVLPLAVTIGFFSNEIAFLWLQDSSIAKEVPPIASLLLTGTSLNRKMNTPPAPPLSFSHTPPTRLL